MFLKRVLNFQSSLGPLQTVQSGDSSGEAASQPQQPHLLFQHKETQWEYQGDTHAQETITCGCKMNTGWENRCCYALAIQEKGLGPRPVNYEYGIQGLSW